MKKSLIISQSFIYSYLPKGGIVLSQWLDANNSKSDIKQ